MKFLIGIIVIFSSLIAFAIPGVKRPCTSGDWAFLKVNFDNVIPRIGMDLYPEIKGLMAEEMAPSCSVTPGGKVPNADGQVINKFELRSGQRAYTVSVVSTQTTRFLVLEKLRN